MADEKLIALRAALEAIRNNGDYDQEAAHIHADDLIIEYIGDAEVSRIYESIEKWYA